MSGRARQRVAAVIIRDGCVLMVRERGKGPSGLHDGPEYWTLPGGGVEAGEDLATAVRREVAEETGLRALEVRYAYEAPYPSGWTSCFRVEVAPGEPRLGVDGHLECACPRMVGLTWMPLARSAPDGPWMVPTLLSAVPD
ncbi:NUDIX hydrolase [Streptomyces sp. NPDC054904]|uniref:NUDIX hydrolase n=1 Tax=unclassified Streptomyces TaxID=2593676 RepID=UPI002481FF0C|nr:MULTISPECIES: NUDIX hydrolase [unclassified Streptomyces]MDA5282813.1 NUDIX hydrolase [Streptomyces sp. Isolate_45]MDX2393053.1 NUDIX hydrolase [Streptomyces sp. DK15]